LPTNTYSADGTPLLSWRVHILPYLEYDDLHQQFNLNEPWDGPTNRKLLDQLPRIYADPRDQSWPRPNRTFYRGFSSAGAVFERRSIATRTKLIGGGLDKPPPGVERFDLRSLKDPPAGTILVVEAGDPVEWTKPDDLDAAAGKPFPTLGGMNWRGNRFNVLFADGSVRFLRSDLPETTLRALVTHSGGEPLPANWEK
jgi:prepilin-type processing-associated H-X9-DG protein